MAKTWRSRPILIQQLAEQFGRRAVVIHTQHHLQVLWAGGKHDIWCTNDGDVKYRTAGYAGPTQTARDFGQLVAAIERYTPKGSALGKMQEAWETAEAIDEALVRLRESGEQSAVFCDAGVKDGLAKIGWIYITQGEHGPTIRVQVWYDRLTIQEAERAAIRSATGACLAEPLPPVYSDCKTVVEEECRNRNDNRVQWLPRTENRVADRIANMRGQDGAARPTESTAPWEDPRGEELPGTSDSGVVSTDRDDPQARGNPWGPGECDAEPPGSDAGASPD